MLRLAFASTSLAVLGLFGVFAYAAAGAVFGWLYGVKLGSPPWYGCVAVWPLLAITRGRYVHQ